MCKFFKNKESFMLLIVADNEYYKYLIICINYDIIRALYYEIIQRIIK